MKYSVCTKVQSIYCHCFWFPLIHAETCLSICIVEIPNCTNWIAFNSHFHTSVLPSTHSQLNPCGFHSSIQSELYRNANQWVLWCVAIIVLWIIYCISIVFGIQDTVIHFTYTWKTFIIFFKLFFEKENQISSVTNDWLFWLNYLKIGIYF